MFVFFELRLICNFKLVSAVRLALIYSPNLCTRHLLLAQEECSVQNLFSSLFVGFIHFTVCRCQSAISLTQLHFDSNVSGEIVCRDESLNKKKPEQKSILPMSSSPVPQATQSCLHRLRLVIKISRLSLHLSLSSNLQSNLIR